MQTKKLGQNLSIVHYSQVLAKDQFNCSCQGVLNQKFYIVFIYQIHITNRRFSNLIIYSVFRYQHDSLTIGKRRGQVVVINMLLFQRYFKAYSMNYIYLVSCDTLIVCHLFLYFEKYMVQFVVFSNIHMLKETLECQNFVLILCCIFG